MTDELTPPHWGSQEMPTQQMTGDEINALVERLETMGDVPVSAILDAITTLRARLADANARADRAEFNAVQLTVMVGDDAVEQIEAAVAAQIEADAGIAVAETAMPPQHNIKDQWRSNIGDDVAAAIRAQPHDRTALDAAIRAAKVDAWKEAADLPTRTERLGGQNYAYVRVEEILALIEREATHD